MIQKHFLSKSNRLHQKILNYLIDYKGKPAIAAIKIPNKSHFGEMWEFKFKELLIFPYSVYFELTNKF